MSEQIHAVARRGAAGAALGVLLWLAATAFADAQDGSAAVKAAQGPRNAANVFISGHSLTDAPLDADLEAIAKSLGKSIQWNKQIYLGSPIRGRTTGADGTRWVAPSRGHNKQARQMSVLEELRTGSSIGGARYDTLLITERHDVVPIMIWEHSVRELRDYHERLIENAPGGQTYFYEPWLGVQDKSNPANWIAFEREASTVWQCMTTRINTSLEAEGRSDRILSLPVGRALIALIEEAMAGKIPGLTGLSTRQLMERIFSDDVHLARAGVYYAAALSYSAIYRQSPVGAWGPPGVSAPLAAALQELAWKTVSEYYANYKPLSLAQCRAMMRDRFCEIWDRYQPHNRQGGCVKLFSREKPAANEDPNPFYYDATTDKSYWFPPPRR